MSNFATFRPMLAADLPSLLNAPFGAIFQPKYDGVRCLYSPSEGIPRSRSGKPLNKHISHLICNAFAQLPQNTHTLLFDFEILAIRDSEPPIGTLECCEDLAITAGFCNPNRAAALPPSQRFLLQIFDIFDPTKPNSPYHERAALRNEIAQNYYRASALHAEELPTYPRTTIAFTSDICAASHASTLLAHYEGLILRNPNAAYKQGRSTPAASSSWALLKHKQLHDAEGTILQINPRYENLLPSHQNALGYAEKSHSKDALQALPQCGSILLSASIAGAPPVQFSIGTGWSAAEATSLWRNRAALLGASCTFSYTMLTPQGLPRCARYRTIRTDI